MIAAQHTLPLIVAVSSVALLNPAGTVNSFKPSNDNKLLLLNVGMMINMEERSPLWLRMMSISVAELHQVSMNLS